MTKDLSFNFMNDIYRAIASRPDQIAFVQDNQEVSYHSFQMTIVAFALNLKSRGVIKGSLVHFANLDKVTHAAMVIACGLNGAAFVGADIAAVRTSGLVPSHSVIPDRSWYTIPAGIDRSHLSELAGYASPENAAGYFFTSGTTGSPKAIKYTAERLAGALNGASGIYREHKNTVILPPSSALFSFFPTVLNLFHGNTILSFTYALDINRSGIDHVVGSPNQVLMFVKSLHSPNTAKISTATVAGAAINKFERETLLNVFAEIRTLYGSSEAGSILAGKTVTLANLEDASVGKVLDQAKIEIVDEDGQVLPRNREGRVRTPAPKQDVVYVGQDEMNRTIQDSGWYYPGDTGYIDDDGNLYITGRMDDRLNIGGTKINAALFDHEIAEIEGVEECGMFLRQGDASQRDELAVALVCGAGIDQSALIAKISQMITDKVGSRYVPRAFYFVEQLPRNPNGKIQRHLIDESVRNLTPLTS